MPVRAGRKFPVACIGCELVGCDRLPGDFARLAVHARDRHPVGHERLEKPAPLGIGFLLLEFMSDCAQLLAQLDPEPERVVPEHLAGTPFHHLGAHVERRKQRIERRGRGVQHEEFIEPAVFDAPPLALDVAILDVDLRGLGKARKLFVG